jgi:hypothetical protein
VQYCRRLKRYERNPGFANSSFAKNIIGAILFDLKFKIREYMQKKRWNALFILQSFFAFAHIKIELANQHNQTQK